MRHLAWMGLALTLLAGCETTVSDGAGNERNQQEQETCEGKCLPQSRWILNTPLRAFNSPKILIRVDGMTVYDACRGANNLLNVSMNLTRTQVTMDGRLRLLDGRARLGLEIEEWDTACTASGPFYSNDDAPYEIGASTGRRFVTIDLNR